ncbi:MAG: sugar transferase [Bacteroidales bacterium]|nr:sugar transferase [Bacteroidales bacterium]
MSLSKARTGLIFIDIILLTAAYFFMAWVKSGPTYLSDRYLIGFGFTLVIWVICSFYLKKYHPHKSEKVLYLFRIIVYPNLLTIALLSFIIYAFGTTFYSRLMVFGTLGIATVLEFIVFGLYTYAIRSAVYDNATAFLQQPPTRQDKKRMAEAVEHTAFKELRYYLREAIIQECDKQVADYLEEYADLESGDTLMLSTTTRFNVLKQPHGLYNSIINLKRVNDIQYLNKFFEAVNHKLPENGTFFGCAETKDQRKKRILAKFPPVLNWIAYYFDFILKRLFPKFKPTRKIYFLLTRGNNRVLSRAEILGRLYSCGFEIMDDRIVNGLFVFSARRIKEPAFDMHPTYGPFVRLRRIGKNGNKINVFKLRTMHPYAEYLQDYIHKKNNLADGGKIKDDFRVTTLGKFFRKLWLDELPMVANWILRDVKLVGVRPLSEHYFNLYDEDLRELRIKTRPGLIPPFYADLPKTLDEIQESERKYLEAYIKHPFRTDWKYFWRAMKNIVFKNVRSA